MFLFVGAGGRSPLQASTITEFESSFLKTKIFRFVLPNNLTVLVCPRDNSKDISLCCIIKAGSIYDKEDKYGVSFLTGNLFSSFLQDKVNQLRKKDIKTKFTLSDANYYTENINFEIKTTGADLEPVISILSEVFVDFKPDAISFYGAREKIKKELHKKLSSSEIINQSIIYGQNYSKNQPYNHFYMGNPGTLSKINIEDISSFYGLRYRPENTIIAIAGNVNSDKIKELIDKYFMRWNKGDSVNINFSTNAGAHCNVPLQKKINIQAGDFSKGAYTMVLSNNSISRKSGDYYTFNLLNYILGGNPRKNRLMDSLHKNGANFAYSVFGPSLGDFCWQIHINFNNPEKFEDLIKRVRDVLKIIAAEPVGEEDLSKAKEYFTKKFSELMNDASNLSLMLVLTEYYGLGLDYFDKYESYYNDITSYKILETAGKYLNPDDMNVLIIKQ